MLGMRLKCKMKVDFLTYGLAHSKYLTMLSFYIILQDLTHLLVEGDDPSVQSDLYHAPTTSELFSN